MGFLLPVGGGVPALSTSIFCAALLRGVPLGLTVVDLFAMSALGGAAGSEHERRRIRSPTAPLFSQVGLTVALFVSNEARATWRSGAT